MGVWLCIVVQRLSFLFKKSRKRKKKLSIHRLYIVFSATDISTLSGCAATVWQ